MAFRPIRALRQALTLEARVAGPPTSSNGASSMHLFWGVDQGSAPLIEVAATATITTAPTSPWLYFWALQVSFVSHGRNVGAGHLGLQFHPNYPENGAVNWGGYQEGGGELGGSRSSLGSALGNANTSTFPWRSGAPYRYRIHRSPERGWRGSIVDLERGIETAVRDLWVDATHLASPMVWTEAFAPCDAPSVAVEWRDLEGRTERGELVRPRRSQVNYQSVGDGGCSNTSVEAVDDTIRQITNVPRRTAQGTLL